MSPRIKAALASPPYRHWLGAACGECGLHSNMAVDSKVAAGALGQLSSL